MILEYVAHERHARQPSSGVDLIEEMDGCVVTLKASIRTLRLISAMGQHEAMTSTERDWVRECAGLASAADTIQDRLQGTAG
jgi:hypothetical protein